MNRKERIFALHDTLLEAMLNKNETVLRELIHPEASVFGSAIHEYEKGIGSVMHFYTHSLALLPDDRELDIKKRYFTDLGDSALVEVEFDISFSLEDRAITLLTIRQSTLWSKDKSSRNDEKWLLLHDHSSMPDHLGDIESISSSELLEENLNLEMDAEKLKEKFKSALSRLETAKKQLIKQERLASVGQLAAGIAHEIKNPLNFVNNFTEVIEELVEEVRDELRQLTDGAGNNSSAMKDVPENSSHPKEDSLGNTPSKKLAGSDSNVDIDHIHEILDDIRDNLSMVIEHGKRANSIVKSMLLHSRGKAGKPVPTKLNQLLDEHLKLAYHGMRATDSSFNVDIQSDYDETLPRINLIPQDISRAFLNILNNAMYAAYDYSTTQTDRSPLITIRTKKMDSNAVITIRDNGGGIPDEIREQIFTPFFTTKPAGTGTGLGLSMTADIIKAHDGHIEVNSEAGQFTKFTITIPIR